MGFNSAFKGLIVVFQNIHFCPLRLVRVGAKPLISVVLWSLFVPSLYLVVMCVCVCVCVYICIKGKGKVIPLQARCGPEGG